MEEDVDLEMIQERENAIKQLEVGSSTLLKSMSHFHKHIILKHAVDAFATP